MDQRMKNLIANIERDPWIVLDWKSCQSQEVANYYIRIIDEAIFDMDYERTPELCAIFRGLARKLNDAHISCKAEACYGSMFRLLGHLDVAVERMKEAEKLGGKCSDCLGGVYKRWAAISANRRKLVESVDYYNLALIHFEKEGNEFEICDCLLGRSAARRFSEQNNEGFEDVARAVDMIGPEMPARFFIAGSVNALSLAAACNEVRITERALAIVEKLRERLKGVRLQTRVLGILRWVRGLALEVLGDIPSAVYWLESAIGTFDRLGMKEEQKTARADLARIRRKAKQKETNNRHIVRLIEQTLRLDVDERTEQVLRLALKNPSPENIQRWRACCCSCVTDLGSKQPLFALF